MSQRHLVRRKTSHLAKYKSSLSSDNFILRKERCNVIQVQDTISVIICCYTEQRWEDLLAAVASVRRQTLRASEIIVVVDHNPLLLRRVQEYLPDVVPMENKGSRGLSGARNSGIARARGSLIAFLDDDAVAMPDWLQLLQEDLRYRGSGSSSLVTTAGYLVPRRVSVGGRLHVPGHATDRQQHPQSYWCEYGISARGFRWHRRLPQ